MNIVIISGRLGHDPSTRYATTGTAITRFSLATDDWAGKDGKKTNWHQVQCFGKTAELAQEYLKKGASVTVQGRIDYQEWTSKEGEQKKATIIIADRLEFGGATKKEHGQEHAQRQEGQNERGKGPEGDIPF